MEERCGASGRETGKAGNEDRDKKCGERRGGGNVGRWEDVYGSRDGGILVMGPTGSGYGCGNGDESGRERIGGDRDGELNSASYCRYNHNLLNLAYHEYMPN